MISNRISSFSLIIVLVFSAAALPLQAQDSRFRIESARNAALGGAHAALTDQYSTIFNNAAGYRGVESDLSVSELTFKVTGPVSTMILAAQGGDIVEILGELGSSNLGLEVVGPFSFGQIKNNKAWAVFNIIDIDVFIPDLTQDATVKGHFDLGGAFGYSFGIDFTGSDSQMDFGFLAKLFYRTEMNVVRSFADVMVAIDDITSLISPDTLPIDFGFGVGVDLGVKYIWKNTFSFGIAVRDLYTPLFMFRYDSLTSLADGGSPEFDYRTLPQDYSVGIMYTPDLILFKGLIGNIRIMLDYNDIFDFAVNSEYARHFLLHFGAGIEFTVFDILSLRFGLYEGLPAVGGGLDLHVFKLNYAMFGRELGSQPGLMSVYNLMIGVEFSY